MPDAVLAHCWTGAPEQAWYPSFRDELMAGGWNVRVPPLPNTDLPTPAEWLGAFSDAVGVPNADTLLVGHSLGCATVLRYLESLPDDVRLGGIVLVAAFSRPLGVPAIDAFHAGGFDWPRLQARPEPKRVILGGEDPYLKHRLGDECVHFARQFGADVILLAGAGHFSPASGCVRLPDVALACKQLLKRMDFDGTH